MVEINGTVLRISDFLSPDKQIIYSSSPNSSSPKPYCLDQGRTYIIPDYQREFRWEKEQVIELISNIASNSLFLGTVMLAETNRQTAYQTDNGQFAGNSILKDYAIIDGQQRITTLLMILTFIRSKYGEDLDMDRLDCALKIESFSGFSMLCSHFFNPEIATAEEIINSDDLNQLPHYLKIWEEISNYSDQKSSALRNRSECQKLLNNIKASAFNVIINTSGHQQESIQLFIDVNLKGKKLDTEDIFKSYLFSYDSRSEIREKWVSIKKLSAKLTFRKGGREKNIYPLMEVIRHSFYCLLYKEKNWKSIELRQDFCLAKNVEIQEDKASAPSSYHRGDHIINVLQSRKFLKQILTNVEAFLSMAVDVTTSSGPSDAFKAYFYTDKGNRIDEDTIAIAYAFIKRILRDDNTLPKAVLFKYFISTMLPEQVNKSMYKWIFDVYAFNIFFDISNEKKDKGLVLNIVSEKKEGSDWHSELSQAIRDFLKHTELSEAKIVSQYKYADDEINEESLSRGLAVLYNYFSIQGGKCRVKNETELRSFLTNTDSYSLEHFLINHSRQYELSTENQYPIPGLSGKCVNSMFNFIFIPKSLNNELGNKTIREKMEILEIPENMAQISCAYSRNVLELIKTYFLANPPQVPDTFPFPDLKDLTDEKKRAKLNAYLTEIGGDDSKFFQTFIKFSREILKDVYEKIQS